MLRLLCTAALLLVLPAAAEPAAVGRATPQVVVLAAAPAPVTPQWQAPVALQVVRPFGRPASRYAAGHRGVDLAAAAGSPVLAAGAGTVVQAGPVAGRPVVSVEHADGLRTTYEPVLPTVRRGQEVRAGEVLGTLGPVHAGCGACLHWGLRRAGPDGVDYLDPLALLRRGPSRLLPLPG